MRETDRTVRPLIGLWLPVVSYMVFIFALSSIERTPSMPGGSDKFLHALLYSGLGFLFARAWAGGSLRVSLGTVALAVAFGAVYGASDELHQYFNPPRAVEGADLIADTIGAGLGASLLWAWGIIRARNGV